MRIAILSDIHGNLAALHAVLADVATRAVDRIVNLGDSLSGPLLPRETAELLMQQPWLQLAGNHERQMVEFDPADGNESDSYARSTLDARALSWLSSLPKTATLEGDVLLCHGTPRSDCEGLLETVDPAGTRLATALEIEARLGDTRAALIACGHTHVPRATRTRSGTWLVNPGSVGLPAFVSRHPYPHVVQTGSPDARYAIAERSGTDFRIELRTVPYDHTAAAALARTRGRLDWEVALRTGYAAGLPAT